MSRSLLASLTVVTVLSHLAQAADVEALRSALDKVESNVWTVGGEETRAERREELRRSQFDAFRNRRREANRADVETWRTVKTREQWERLRDERIARLESSLGTFPKPPDDLHVRVTATLRGDGYEIQNLVFDSRPGWPVTANLYVPAEPRASMPGILICHSHHRPKVQGELQDMGTTWARAGCCVLVMDQLGHGERRAHPFAKSSDYDGEFRVSRQDYHFRYVTGMQLHWLGDSLIGWMAWDLMRGVDLLLDLPGVDEERIILLGAVAGGGDPAAVTAALDPRIDAVVPFNFGGPQPETVYPLPEDGEFAFNYFGGGSWESTRNLRNSIGEGFPHWLIVASVAPRRLIHAHEFAWDRDRDPVWRRYERIHGEFYGAPDGLSWAKGRGSVRGRPPEATHCTNIGPVHRAQIHPAFERWFGIEAEEFSDRREESALLVLEGADVPSMPTLGELAGPLADERARQFRGLLPRERTSRRRALRTRWAELLGVVDPAGKPRIESTRLEKIDGLRVERVVLSFETDGVTTRVPLMILSTGTGERSTPTVVCLAQSGKAGFLEHRVEAIADLLAADLRVVIPDLRGFGENSVGTYRGRRSSATGLSSSVLMLGETVVGWQLSDLRTVLAWLRSHGESGTSFVLWADSFAPSVPRGTPGTPLGIDGELPQAEPVGHVLALLGGLYEDDVSTIVSARGGLTSFRSTLDSQFVNLPHDLVVPGAISAGDLPTLEASFAPRPVLAAGLVDARNQPATDEASATTVVRRLVKALKGSDSRP